MATISAQLIFRPSLSQPLESFQKSQQVPKTIPMPHDDEASTQKLVGETGGGFDSFEPQKSEVSWLRHHLTSDRTLGLGSLRA
jgi:hypothetical protein